MKTTELNERLRKDRPLMAITVRMPEDVVQDLKRVAPAFGFSSDDALIRHYIGQGLRIDLERLNYLPTQTLIESLKRQGVPNLVIDKAIEETEQQAFSALS
ncbi:hypothetical protein PN36_33465 [Candidatus Thiomargarita nelsonii]|uniref:CopG family transcriptional regulator n=1 Tax=Candidatus Thiomargarita nelsonii TaxID=1003181 RepID=A0A4E0QM75_9GAMM|nr:hypothetical protein PN36_33465 [Candidatus Thiomargarita nelsonii]